PPVPSVAHASHVAERIRRAVDRHAAPRTARPRHRARGAAFAPLGPPACRLLQRGPTPYVAPRRCADRAPRGTTERGRRRRATAAGTRGRRDRAASVLRHHTHTTPTPHPDRG